MAIMKKCISCNETLTDPTRFCAACGAAQPVTTEAATAPPAYAPPSTWLPLGAPSQGKTQGGETTVSEPVHQSSPTTNKHWKDSTVVMVILAVSLAILAALVAGMYGSVVLLDQTLTAKSLQTVPAKLVVSAFLLIGAIILYRIKMSSFQSVYGLIEIAAGLVVNWRSLESLARQLAGPMKEDPLFARLAALVGGLYLIGRGVANFAEGIKKRGARQ